MTDDDALAAQAASFGAAAQAYERGRPGYPEEALDWLLPAGARRVLDLGAGTGKLTRQLTARGLDVVAVEPSEGMRAELSRVLPDVPALEGSAERIPLETSSVDAVLVAQAWHWVDPARASTEVARVLVRGGRLGLVWNARDDEETWVAELGQIMAGGARDHVDRPVVGDPFGPLERFDVRWTHRLSLEQLLDLVASRSYVILRPDEERRAMLASVRELVDRHPNLKGGRSIAMPYITQSFRAER